MLFPQAPLFKKAARFKVASFLVCLLALPPLAGAQTGFTWGSSSSFTPSGSQATTLEPPRDTRIEEKAFAALSNRDIDALGKKALDLQPQKWKHAETDHFILHYRRMTEAQKVARETEFTLAFTARFLGAGPERYAKKSHLYVFLDKGEWNQFIHNVGVMEWSASFAHGDNLYLCVADGAEPFDSRLLAHETTHAVVSRLYPGKAWPRWLNEGLAEYIGGASIAARKKIWKQGLQNQLPLATLSPDELVAIVEYPTEREEVTRFYQSSEKLIRFLLNQYPQERFPRFVDEILTPTPFKEAFLKIYGDQVKDYSAFLKAYERFAR